MFVNSQASAGVARRGHRPSNLDGLAVVEGLEFGKLLRITFDEVGELVDEAGTLKAGDVLAPGGLEGVAGRGDSEVDVLLGTWSGRVSDSKRNVTSVTLSQQWVIESGPTCNNRTNHFFCRGVYASGRGRLSGRTSRS